MFELSFAPLKGKGRQVKDGQGCLRISILTWKSFPHYQQPSPNLPVKTRKKEDDWQFFSLFLSPLQDNSKVPLRILRPWGWKPSEADHLHTHGGRAAREPWKAEPGSVRKLWPWLSRPTSEEHEATPTAVPPSPRAAAKNQTCHRREPQQGQLPGAREVSLGS